MATEGQIKRRRRAAPEPIPEGSRKNITFLASSYVYNLLVQASETSGRSISDCLEIHLTKNRDDHSRPKFEDVFLGSPQSMNALKLYSIILATYGQSGSWKHDEKARVAVIAAMRALNDRLMPTPEGFGPEADASDQRVVELRSAWSLGAQFGALLAGPFPGGDERKSANAAADSEVRKKGLVSSRRKQEKTD